ncbi:MAG TPA: NADH-quinone oxidoreductase subunit A [Phycisphaerae bacterium]|nr:NADH-quinone oxidoreductase subunit A [Phycisphaerae bacterium]HNU44928.1 NADH-quinone oxidoreductase subunit A [Phycisphaerae bacterium]
MVNPAVIASLEPYTAIGVTILLAIAAAVGALAVAHGLGPKRGGPVKDSPYESGMPIAQDTARRFNLRFYLVALLFLLFDVEVVFLWPWAQAYYAAATGSAAPVVLDGGQAAGKGFLLIGMGLFFGLLVFGLAYEWLRGAFRWNQ